jgi:twinkle protein
MMTDRKPSSIEVRREACECGSSDGRVVFADGHKHCFVCNKHWKANASESTQAKQTVIPVQKTYNPISDRGEYTALHDRRIKKETCEFFGVKAITNVDGSVHSHIYPYYDRDKSLVANKIRTVENKSFRCEGNLADATMFGQHKFSGGGKYITICEGEIDAMSAYELLGSKWPVISVRAGAQGAIKDIKANYEYINSFETIVVCFDNDEPGLDAANKVAQVFEPLKCKIMNLNLKDANEYLQQNKREEFTRAFWNATPYTPAGIIRLCDNIETMFQKDNRLTVKYPFQGLNEKLYGIRTGELVTITAGTGAGKTSMMYEIEYHMLKNTDCNIGIVHLEEGTDQTRWHLVSIPANKRLFVDEEREGLTQEDVQAYLEDTVLDPRLISYAHFGSQNVDELLSKIRYMVKAMDCKYVVIDHLNIIVSGFEEGDERRNIDMLMTKLRSLVEETQCGILLVSHLRRGAGDTGTEQGREISLSMLRGSHSIAQLSDGVIALERDQQAKDPVQANTTTVRVLKNRYAGETGIATYLLYDKNTGRMAEIDDPFKEEDNSDIEDYL